MSDDRGRPMVQRLRDKSISVDEALAQREEAADMLVAVATANAGLLYRTRMLEQELQDTTARAERAEADWLRTYNAYLFLFNTIGTIRKWLADGEQDIPDETIKSFRQRVDIEAGYLSAQEHVSNILAVADILSVTSPPSKEDE